MPDLVIKAVSHIGREGVTLHFNRSFSPNGGIRVKELWVSWDRIGKALFGVKYSNETDVDKLNKLRNSEGQE